jgi:nucleotide-binding universal stress UspA family protein
MTETHPEPPLRHTPAPAQEAGVSGSASRENGTSGADGAVVVGFDGSPAAGEALRYALAEGARRGRPVRVVAAFTSPESWAFADGVYPLVEPDEMTRAMTEDARLTVDELRNDLDERLRAVPVEVTAVPGPPSVVLCEAARGAALMVVGHRGRGGIRSALLGSVGLSVVMHAPCPVSVVH